MAFSRAGGWTVAILLFLTAPTVWAIARVLDPADGPVMLAGVRLGMTPADVRRSFDLAAEGHFQSEAPGLDFALSWTPIRPGGVEAARFEFHEALLVAVRLRGRSGALPALDGPAFEETPGSVLARRAGPRVTEVTWLSRDCPTHSAEVTHLMAGR